MALKGILRQSFLMLIFCLIGIRAQARASANANKPSKSNLFSISSASFHNKGEIPGKFTCQGQNISPALQWTHIPPGSKSLVLIVRDPDAPDPKAPKMTWYHWVVYNIPATVSEFSKGMAHLPKGAVYGLNSWHKPGYGGPCPPIGRHRYFFELSALNTVLHPIHQPTVKRLERAMTGHVLATAQMVGTYQKR